LEGFPAQTKYPMAQVSINGDVIYNAPVVDYVEIPFISTEKVNNYQIIIKYYNKQPDDIVVNNQEQIIENQQIKIKKMMVNSVDIIQTYIINNLGNYTKTLTKIQQEYYLKHGYDTGPSQSLDMYDNGQWTMDFKMPVLAEFIQLRKHHIEYERPWFNDLNYQIYNTINNIRALEKKIDK
jgi:hypothetical protein